MAAWIEDGDDSSSSARRPASRISMPHILVHDRSAWRDFVFGGSIGGAEAYMLGKWSSPHLLDVVRVMSANIDVLNGMDDSRFIGQR